MAPEPVWTLVARPSKAHDAGPCHLETRGDPRCPRMPQVHMPQVCTPLVHAPVHDPWHARKPCFLHMATLEKLPRF